MIDIKEFRVGSHVMVDGKRIRLQCLGINENNEPFILHRIGEDTYNIKLDEISPIRITGELLANLGWKVRINKNDFRQFLWRKDPQKPISESIDCVIATQCDGGYHIRLQGGFDTVGKIVVDELHQLENFVFLATGLELIDD